MSVDMSSFLLGGGSAGAPALKFSPKDKTAHTLTVSEEPELRQQAALRPSPSGGA
jgi:predicted YcjX-like family ATPase